MSATLRERLESIRGRIEPPAPPLPRPGDMVTYHNDSRGAFPALVLAHGDDDRTLDLCIFSKHNSGPYHLFGIRVYNPDRYTTAGWSRRD